MKNLCLFRKNEPTINDMETCTTMVHHHPVSWCTYRLFTTCATLAIPGSLPERELRYFAQYQSSVEQVGSAVMR